MTPHVGGCKLTFRAFNLSYNKNGASRGTVPTDNNNYSAGANATVQGNPRELIKGSRAFAYRNTAADYSGTVFLLSHRIA